MSASLAKLWENAGVDGGPPCIGDFFVCHCKGCTSLEDKVHLELKVVFNKEHETQIRQLYLTKEDYAIYTQAKEKFERAMRQFSGNLGEHAHLCILPDFDNEVNEVLRGFIQFEKSTKDVISDLWTLMIRRELVDEDLTPKMPLEEQEAVKNALLQMQEFYRS